MQNFSEKDAPQYNLNNFFNIRILGQIKISPDFAARLKNSMVHKVKK